MPIPVVLLVHNAIVFRVIINLGNGHRLKRRALVLLLRDLKDKAIVVKADRTKQHTVLVSVHIGQQRRRFRCLRVVRNNRARKTIRHRVAQYKNKLKHYKHQQRFSGKALSESGQTVFIHGTSKQNDEIHRNGLFKYYHNLYLWSFRGEPLCMR